MYLRKHFVESGFRQHAAQGFDRLRKLVFVAVKGVCLAQAEALPAVDHDRLPAPRLRVQVNREFAQLLKQAQGLGAQRFAKPKALEAGGDHQPVQGRSGFSVCLL